MTRIPTARPAVALDVWMRCEPCPRPIPARRTLPDADGQVYRHFRCDGNCMQRRAHVCPASHGGAAHPPPYVRGAAHPPPYVRGAAHPPPPYVRGAARAPAYSRGARTLVIVLAMLAALVTTFAVQRAAADTTVPAKRAAPDTSVPAKRAAPDTTVPATRAAPGTIARAKRVARNATARAKRPTPERRATNSPARAEEWEAHDDELYDAFAEEDDEARVIELTPRVARDVASLPAPRIDDVLAAAYRTAGLDGDIGRGFARRARLAGLVPLVSVRTGRDSSWRDSSPDVSRGMVLDVRATWRLDRLVFDGRELQAVSLDAARRRERRAVASRVIALYFDWKRAAGRGAEADAEADAEAEEAAAALDDLTAGWFTEEVRRARASGSRTLP